MRAYICCEGEISVQQKACAFAASSSESSREDLVGEFDLEAWVDVREYFREACIGYSKLVLVNFGEEGKVISTSRLIMPRSLCRLLVFSNWNRYMGFSSSFSSVMYSLISHVEGSAICRKIMPRSREAFGEDACELGRFSSCRDGQLWFERIACRDKNLAWLKEAFGVDDHELIAKRGRAGHGPSLICDVKLGLLDLDGA